MDKESNLADHGVRKYENEVGVFTSIDQLWEDYRSWTPYQYAGNNPITYIDESGLSQRDPNKDPEINSQSYNEMDEMDYDGSHFRYLKGKWGYFAGKKQENNIYNVTLSTSLVDIIGVSADLSYTYVNGEHDLTFNFNGNLSPSLDFGLAVDDGVNISIGSINYSGYEKLSSKDLESKNDIFNLSGAYYLGAGFTHSKINGYNANQTEIIGGLSINAEVGSKKEIFSVSAKKTINDFKNLMNRIFYIPNIRPF